MRTSSAGCMVEGFVVPIRERCQVFIVEIVGAAQLGIFIRGYAQNRAKGPDVGDMKKRLRDGAPPIAVKCLQDEVIGMPRRSHHLVIGPAWAGHPHYSRPNTS